MAFHRRALSRLSGVMAAGFIAAGLFASAASAQLLPHKELFDAIKANNLSELRRIVLGGMSVNQTDEDGKPAVAYAAELNRYYLIDFMAENGGNLNARTEDRRETALMMAASSGALESVETLLEAGADLNAEDRSGETALMKAVRNGHFRVVRTLVEGGADINHADYTGRTALVYAEESRERGIQRFLEGQGATY